MATKVTSAGARPAPVVVAFFGAPCVGKTSLADALARALKWPVFSRDPLIAVLLDAGVPLGPTGQIRGVGGIGIALQTSLIEHHLDLGQSVIVECVAHRLTREHWRQIAGQHGGQFIAIRCVCSDNELHRRRFEDRQRIRRARNDRWGYATAAMTFEQAEESAAAFDSDTDAGMTVDAIHSLNDNLRTVSQYLHDRMERLVE